MSQISAVIASAIEGRLQNPRHRRRLLVQLRERLIERYDEIFSAIKADAEHTDSEISVQIYCTLQHIRATIEDQNLDDANSQALEYALSRGEDSSDRSVGVPLVLVEPASYTRFFSILAPLSAVIAAGSCVLLKVNASLSTHEIDGLLKKLLPEVLNEEGIVTACVPTDFEMPFGVPNLHLHGEQSFIGVIDGPSQASLTLKGSKKRVVAIVDRSADIAHAAHQIMRSRFNFNGQSPYAPDLVLVHEFVVKDFNEACLKDAWTKVEAMLGDESRRGNKTTNRAQDTKILGYIEKANADGDSLLMQDPAFSLIHIRQHNSSLLKERIHGPLLLVKSFSSLNDALEAASTINEPLEASYIFSEQATAKYLSQFLYTSASVINQIPAKLLVGPQTPSGYLLSFERRFRPEMFSSPSPQFIEGAEGESFLATSLDSTPSATAMSKKLRSVATETLPVIERPEQLEKLGYFQAGYYFGIFTIMLPLVIGALGVTYRALPWIWRSSKSMLR